MKYMTNYTERFYVGNEKIHSGEEIQKMRDPKREHAFLSLMLWVLNIPCAARY